LSSKPEYAYEAERADEEERNQVTPILRTREHNMLRIARIIEEGNALSTVALTARRRGALSHDAHPTGRFKLNDRDITWNENPVEDAGRLWLMRSLDEDDLPTRASSSPDAAHPANEHVQAAPTKGRADNK
jgi:hypothetical protein